VFLLPLRNAQVFLFNLPLPEGDEFRVEVHWYGLATMGPLKQALAQLVPGVSRTSANIVDL
jgi:undecaprenyl pyrophosphate phosphatase UppP